jgi:hypothetical protein
MNESNSKSMNQKSAERKGKEPAADAHFIVSSIDETFSSDHVQGIDTRYCTSPLCTRTIITIILISDQCQKGKEEKKEKRRRKASNPKMDLWTGYPHIRTLQPPQSPHRHYRHCTPRIHARMDGTHEHTRRNPSQEQCQQCSVVGEGRF